MIAQLGPNHIMHKLGCSVLSQTKPSRYLWFSKIRATCTRYSLPDPIDVLTAPPSKQAFKKLVKSKVIQYWELKLREEASKLPSLQYFKPQFYSLLKPHPIWLSAGNNPYEVEKACCQARMLSGRYRTCWLSRYWSEDRSGHCSLPTCRLNPTPGSLEHILVECEDLQPARTRAFHLWSKYLKNNPTYIPIVLKYTTGSEKHNFVQFLLDCTVLSEVISHRQLHGNGVHDSLLYLTRTFCFSVHKARLKLLGKWNIIS